MEAKEYKKVIDEWKARQTKEYYYDDLVSLVENGETNYIFMIRPGLPGVDVKSFIEFWEGQLERIGLSSYVDYKYEIATELSRGFSIGCKLNSTGSYKLMQMKVDCENPEEEL